MRTLNFYELGVDPLPKEDARIVFFDADDGYDLFERINDTRGAVSYSYGDLHDTITFPDEPEECCISLKDAFECGYRITLEDDGFDGECNPNAITLTCDNTGEQLLKGTFWVYEHEIIPTLGYCEFPFQDEKYFAVAVKENWVRLLNSEDVEVVGKHMYGPKAGEDDVRKFRHDIVEFNDKKYKVIWYKKGWCLSFQSFEDYVDED